MRPSHILLVLCTALCFALTGCATTGAPVEHDPSTHSHTDGTADHTHTDTSCCGSCSKPKAEEKKTSCCGSCSKPKLEEKKEGCSKTKAAAEAKAKAEAETKTDCPKAKAKAEAEAKAKAEEKKASCCGSCGG